MDATPWLTAHPSSEVRACYGDHCATIDASTPRPPQLIHGDGSPSQPLSLSVKAEGGPDSLVATEKIGLKKSTFTGGACGPVSSWGRIVILDAQGQLQDRGWDGRAPLDGVPVPTPTAS
ncbi:hypothetical protein [Gryllotalpicola protaetiae]|uniref:hypothetical protein n=1 Tax=Gryllotalpicola protaetiae TaxID=2419771 RepID=UPI0013C4812C|nr:hypothetical protein [Gryllotalpicola protaetiae]